MITLPHDTLIASYWTLCGGGPGNPSPWSIAERAEAAARAGFSGIGLRNDDFVIARQTGITDVALRRSLADAGIVVAEIEFVAGWSSGNQEMRRSARLVEEELYSLSDALGEPCNLNVGCSEALDAPQPFEAVVDRFSGLCDRAAAHGLTVALEFMPWTAIPDADCAWDVVRLADRSNAGVLIDAWHYFRGAADPAQLQAIPIERIAGLQIDDADAQVQGSMRNDTLHHRRLPGEGSFDLVAWVRTIEEMGVLLPYAVEVISDAQFALPLDVAASRAFDSTRSVLARGGLSTGPRG